MPAKCKFRGVASTFGVPGFIFHSQVSMDGAPAAAAWAEMPIQREGKGGRGLWTARRRLYPGVS